MTEYVTIEKNVYDSLVEIAEDYPKIKKEVEELRRLLKLYQSPHVPLSKRLINEKKNDEQKEEPKKRGAPEDHYGATIKLPEPDQFRDLKPDGCKKSRCTGRIKILNSYRKRVVDVEIKPICTEYTVYRCQCLCCGEVFETTDSNLPKEGHFGPNYSSLMNVLHYRGHIPFDNLANISGSCLGIDISTKGLQDVIYRTTSIFELDFQNIKNMVSNSDFIRSDESGYPCYIISIKGKFWGWVVSNGVETVVLIRPSRGTCVLEEIIPRDYSGVLLTDFYTSYLPFKNAERAGCWSHILRDSDELGKTCGKEGKQIDDELNYQFTEIKKVKDRHKEGTVHSRHIEEKLKSRIVALKRKKWRQEDVVKFVERLQEIKDWLFTCLRYSFVPATNNNSEGDIRKLVLSRKISGCHRSELGIHSREIMMSVILTEVHKGNNPIDFIKEGIMRYNNS
jgi:transposase